LTYFQLPFSTMTYISLYITISFKK